MLELDARTSIHPCSAEHESPWYQDNIRFTGKLQGPGQADSFGAVPQPNTFSRLFSASDLFVSDRENISALRASKEFNMSAQIHSVFLYGRQISHTFFALGHGAYSSRLCGKAHSHLESQSNF